MRLTKAHVPGVTLLHPLSVTCLIVLVVNDHVLKRACPGMLTGKLSDFSGLFLLPLFLHALFEWAYEGFRERPCPPKLSREVLAFSAFFSALGFTLAELGGLGEVSYRFGLAALQWPFRALFSLLGEQTLPGLVPVRATADLGDLLALPMVFLAYRVGSRELGEPRGARVGRHSTRWPLLLGASVALTGATASQAFASESAGGNPAPSPVISLPAEAAPKRAAEPVTSDARREPRGAYRHDGFYLAFDLGAGAACFDSSASISNGFRQPIASSARGLAFPTGSLALGGTLPLSGMALVIGARVGMGTVHEPVIHTLGESFRVPNLSLQLVELQVIAKLYPNPSRGLYFGVGAGGMSVERSDAFKGEFQRGFSLSLEGGHEFWVLRQWSLGVGGRLTAGRVNGEDFGHTTVVVPALIANVVFH